MIRAAALSALLLALVVALGTVREARLGGPALAAAGDATTRGDWPTAIARAQEAAECAFPGSPYARAGLERLKSLAETAEARGDPRTAVDAWGALRAAATATASPLLGTSSWSALADDGLARVGSRPLTPSGEAHASEEVLRASLARDDTPGAGLLALAGLGGLAFFAGAARLAWAAPDRASLRREALAVTATVAGFVAYALACLRG